MTVACTPASPLWRRLATMLAGIVLVGCGVALTIEADLGVAPFDVLTTGVHERTGLVLGLAAIVPPVVFVAVGLALGGRPGLGTALATVGVGPVLGLAAAAVPDVSAMPVRLGLFVVGSLVVACGITAVIIAEIGPGPAELAMLALHDRGHSLALVRTGIEITSVAVGWALGGQVGAGTVAVALTIGPILRQLLRVAGYRSAEPEEAALRAAPGA